MKGSDWLRGMIAILLMAAAYALGRWQGSPGSLPVLTPAGKPAPSKLPAAAAADGVGPALPKTSAPTQVMETSVKEDFASWSVHALEKRLRTLDEAHARQLAAELGRAWATTKSPQAVLQLCNDLPREWRFEALRNAAIAWVERTARAEDGVKNSVLARLRQRPLNPGTRDAFLTSLLGQAKVSDDILLAWTTMAGTGPQRADTLSSLSSIDSPASADMWFRQTQNWTPWEREQFAGDALAGWAETDPGAAWRWAQQHPDLATQEGMTAVLREMEKDDLTRLLPGLRDPTQRLAAISEFARRQAVTDTAAAVQWADALPNEAERDAAQAAIYDTAPRGIGAMLNSEDGFARLANVTAGSAAEQAGLQVGDRLVELIEPDGTKRPLHGQPLGNIVGYIRGEPGTTVQLRILRTDARGNVTEQWIPVIRQQIMFKQQSKP